MKYYSYFFTRQDISPEQQLVQTAHAAFLLGVRSQRQDDSSMNPIQLSNETIDPEETYFTVVGVRNQSSLLAVIEILEKFEIDYEVFNEPDMGNEYTSIGVYPIPETERGPLLAFNLLKM